ncbi:dienelactone hydrolase family protein [soil metagenome]
METQKLDYYDNNVALEAYIAYPKDMTTPRPAVLIAHDWSGRNAFACNKADQLAAMGYVGCAIDMYGKGVLGETKEQKQALIAPFLANPAYLQQRITAAFTAISQLDKVASQRIAAIGFCFGGLCVINLACSDVAIQGVVSFHGLLGLAKGLSKNKITAKVLALHGHNDPMVTPEDVALFEQEMTAADADWQLTVYGNTMHGFTNPQANDPVFGTVYNEVVTKRAWVSMQNFLAEVLM